MSRKVITPEMAKREARMIAARKRGATVGQLSREHGLTHMAVRGILAKHGMTGPPPVCSKAYTPAA